MKKSIGLIPLALFLAACVTVNIYFPEAAAEDAARTIVRDVIGAEGNTPAAEPAPEPGSRFEQEQSVHTALLHGLLNLLIAPAHAQADIDISTPAISQLRQSLRQRHNSLEPYLQSGAIGLTREGLMGLRDLSVVPLNERNRLNQLLAAENQDLNALYREIARANDHPEWAPQIRTTFIEVWIEEFPAGTWYQDSSGTWKQK